MLEYGASHILKNPASAGGAETRVRSLVQKDPLESPMDRGAYWATVGVTQVRTQLNS